MTDQIRMMPSQGKPDAERLVEYVREHVRKHGGEPSCPSITNIVYLKPRPRSDDRPADAEPS